MGEGDAFSLDTSSDFVVCVNYLGSPYGTASPVTPDPDKDDGRIYAADFPTPVTIRDNVRLQRMLLDRLGVKHLKMAIGGSMGSMVALEWAACYPDYVDELVLIAGCGRHTDWAIGIGEAQRFSIMADAKFNGGDYDINDPPRAGLATSRMMAMLSYRAPASVDERFRRSVMEDKNGQGAKSSLGIPADGGGLLRKPSVHADLGNNVKAHANEEMQSLPYFCVESYLQYQGKKFIQRFDANCYIQLTYTLDSHDVARDRGSYLEVLSQLKHRTLVVGITSDVLYPFELQTELQENMPNAELYAIDSPHGHDAFLIEITSLNDAIARFRRGEVADPNPRPARCSVGAAALSPRESLKVEEMNLEELQAAVRMLEMELVESREREEREARRADKLQAQVGMLKDQLAVREGGGDKPSEAGTLTGMMHGIRLMPRDPGPAGSSRFQPVYGEVKSSGTDGNGPTNLGAF